jgi:hypothetical protein
MCEQQVLHMHVYHYNEGSCSLANDTNEVVIWENNSILKAIVICEGIRTQITNWAPSCSFWMHVLSIGKG